MIFKYIRNNKDSFHIIIRFPNNAEYIKSFCMVLVLAFLEVIFLLLKLSLYCSMMFLISFSISIILSLNINNSSKCSFLSLFVFK